MEIKMPRGLKFDIENPPDDLEQQVKKAFAEYTTGTAKEYMYQDKLSFIDHIREYANRIPRYTEEAVIDLMKKYLEYNVENGDIPDESDYLSIEFMQTCYDAGLNVRLYKSGFEEVYPAPEHYISHFSDKVMQILYRAIKAVMEYE